MPRCLLVTNRLPLTFDENSNEFIPSAGGLISSLKGLNSKQVGFDFEWIAPTTQIYPYESGLPGHPVLIPKDIYQSYYNGFCNKVLWPLFHYERSTIAQDISGWENYKKVNSIIADEIIKKANFDDTVWIHDFHFFLIPELLKQKRPDLKVGFFLHIPFPSSEIFRELPQRKEILNSLIQCDLIGFHDLSYLNHFKRSVSRILGEECPVVYKRNWGVYPISIDTDHFIELAERDLTRQYLCSFQKTKKEMKWILGVDRLDHIKGLLQKLYTFESFLRKYPEQIGNVQLIQIVVPSRSDIFEYQTLKQEVEQLVSRINGEFGTPGKMPVHYIFNHICSAELSALYQISEVMHIASSRDGMNLVGLEYVASQNCNHPGTLLLSEFTGAHSTLSYAISINPWNIDETAEKIHDALSRPIEIRQHEMQEMKSFLMNYTSSHWAKLFLDDLNEFTSNKRLSQVPNEENFFPWMSELKNKKILLFCDFDGTLAPLHPTPAKVSLLEETKKVLSDITMNKKIDFVVVSGRDQNFLQDLFTKNNYHFSLAACHGAYSYLPDSQEWEHLIPHDSTNWKENIIEVFKLYTTRTPGSFYEDKGYAIAWHFRNSPEEFADFVANKLFVELEEALSSIPAQVSRGKKIIEVKSLHACKGHFVQHYLERREYLPEVVIAIGDDTSDEDMFEYLQNNASVKTFCIKVGEEKTNAKYSLKDQSKVDSLLLNILMNS